MNSFYQFIGNDFIPIFYSVFWLLIFIFLMRDKALGKKFVKYSLLVFLLITILFVVSQSFLLYSDLQSNEMGEYFMLPYSNYYFEKISESIVSFAISAIIVLSFFLAFFIFSKKTKQEIIDAQDVFLLTFASLILGWPNFLIFLFVLFFLVSFGSILTMIIKNKSGQQRFIITYYIPLAFLIILWYGNYLAEITMLYKIRF